MKNQFLGHLCMSFITTYGNLITFHFSRGWPPQWLAGESIKPSGRMLEARAPTLYLFAGKGYAKPTRLSAFWLHVFFYSWKLTLNNSPRTTKTLMTQLLTCRSVGEMLGSYSNSCIDEYTLPLNTWIKGPLNSGITFTFKM